MLNRAPSPNLVQVGYNQTQKTILLTFFALSGKHSPRVPEGLPVRAIEPESIMKTLRISFFAAMLALALLSATTTRAAPGSAVFQDDGARIWFDSWYGAADSHANGGRYRIGYASNDTATFKFTGTFITWVTVKGPYGGIAEVLIDGVSKNTVDLYASNWQYNIQKTFQGLTNTKHKLVIKNTGTKNPASHNYYVYLDALIHGATTTQENALAIRYNSWKGVNNANASGGSYRTSAAASAENTLIFKGTSVKWVTAMGPSYGKVQVNIDGVSKGIFDLYSPTQKWQVKKTFGGLANGQHDIDIIVLGTKNAASTGKSVVTDAFIVP